MYLFLKSFLTAYPLLILICTIIKLLLLDNDNEDSQKMLRHLELIDDEAAEYEVKMVKIDDPLMAKKYGHRDPPGLGYFRKGNYIKYEGDYRTYLLSSQL